MNRKTDNNNNNSNNNKNNRNETTKITKTCGCLVTSQHLFTLFRSRVVCKHLWTTRHELLPQDRSSLGLGCIDNPTTTNVLRHSFGEQSFARERAWHDNEIRLHLPHTDDTMRTDQRTTPPMSRTTGSR